MLFTPSSTELVAGVTTPSLLDQITVPSTSAGNVAPALSLVMNVEPTFISRQVTCQKHSPAFVVPLFGPASETQSDTLPAHPSYLMQ